MRRATVLASILTLTVVTASQAAVPQLINYQGRLTDTPGSPLSGSYDITFTLYEAPTGGASIWSETHSAATVSDGLFAVALGSITPFSSASPAGNQIWLGITVAPDPELSPRTQMVSVLFAFMADRADTANYANQAGSVDTAGLSYQARQADTADYANRSLFSDTADYAGRSLFSDTADYAERSLFSDTADTKKQNIVDRSVEVPMDKRFQLIEKDGTKYIVYDGKESPLHVSPTGPPYFPLQVCRDNVGITISFDQELALEFFQILQGNLNICVEIWEADISRIDPDDFVISRCATMSHSPGSVNVRVKITFNNVNLVPFIDADFHSGEFYIKVTGDVIDFRTAPEDVSVLDVPALPSYIAPPDGATNVSLPVRLDWTSVPNTEKYRIQVDNNSDFSSPNIDRNVTTSFADVSGLADNSKYFWRVIGFNCSGWGSWSLSGRDFTTICPAVSAPSYVNPPDGATNQSQPVLLEWSTISGADTYIIEIDNNSDFSSTVKTVLTTVSHTSVSGLAELTNYYWRVQAHDSCGLGVWSSSGRDFTTSCSSPSIPSYVNPPDGATNLSQPVFLDWSDVIGADFYQLQVSYDIRFISPELDANFSSSNGNVSGLENGTRYFWRVRAYNSCGPSNWSRSGRDFRTDIPTSVEEKDSPDIPKSFTLYQNYPNPFNPETEIEFSIPRQSLVIIDVFNILGARVRQLVNEKVSAGHKIVTWDGRDDNGSTVASGIYFYKLTAGDFVESKKMLLLK